MGLQKRFQQKIPLIIFVQVQVIAPGLVIDVTIYEEFLAYYMKRKIHISSFPEIT